MKENLSSPPRQPELDRLRLAVEDLQVQIDNLRLSLKSNGAARFNADDQIFLVWVLGFSADAHLDRNGEQGERIFGRCRDLFVKLSQTNGGNAS